MKRLMISLLVGAAPLLAPATALAGSCPEFFHLHAIADGNHEHGEHQHVGLSMGDVDRNGNGYICVKHLTPNRAIHVHIDDFIP